MSTRKLKIYLHNIACYCGKHYKQLENYLHSTYIKQNWFYYEEIETAWKWGQNKSFAASPHSLTIFYSWFFKEIFQITTNIYEID